MKYKLFIQRFTDGTVSANTEDMEAVNTQLTTLTTDIATIMKDITTTALSVVNSDEFKSTTSTAFQNVLTEIEQFTGTDLSESLGSLGTFLQSAIEAYASLDIDYSSEIDSWTSTITDAISSITGGLNSTVEKGSYTASSYASDTSSHISNISSAAKTIVSETASILGDTGKFYTSVTGTTVKDAAVGAINKLFTFASGSASTGKSFLSSLFSK